LGFSTKVWFVMIKDDKGRHTNSRLWGDGWGGAFYKSDPPDKQVAVSYKRDCQGRHIPALKTHWIYIQGCRYSTPRNSDIIICPETPMKKRFVVLTTVVMTIAAQTPHGDRRKSL
jgi:hypothetical protein